VHPSDELTGDLLEAHFTSLREETIGALRPAGSLAARRSFEGRRRRRLLLAATATVAALALAVSGGLALTDRPQRDFPAGPPGGPVPDGFRVVSVTFVSTTSAWVLGYAPCAGEPVSLCPVVLRSRDGGRTWAGVPAPGAAAYGGDIRFANSRDGWIVAHGTMAPTGPDGVSGVLYATHDGGTSWHRVDLPPVIRMETAGGRVWVTTDTDPRYGVYAAPIGTDSFVQVTDSTGTQLVLHGRYAYVYGSSTDAHTAGNELTSIKDGRVTRRPLPCAPDYLHAVTVAAIADTDLAIVCGALPSGTAQPKRAYTSTDAGASWTPAGTPDPAGYPASLAASRSGLFVTGVGMDIQVTRDSGRSWLVAFPKPDRHGFRYVGFTDDSHGVALPYGGGTTIYGTTIYLTTDGGRTWTPHPFG
jgi:photosystem II stability/assembly factor-like uncharacterized protein